MFHRQLSIRDKLALLGVAAVVASSLIVGSASYLAQKRLVERDVRFALTSLVDDGVDHVYEAREHREQVMRAVAQSPLVIDACRMLADDSTDEAARKRARDLLHAQLRLTAQAHDWVVDAYLADPDADRLFASTDPNVVEPCFLSEIDVLRVRRGVLVHTPIVPMTAVVPGVDEQHTILAATPVRDSDERMSAVLAVRLDVTRMLRLRHNHDAPFAYTEIGSLDLYMADETGLMLTPSAFERALRDAGRIHKHSPMNLRVVTLDDDRPTRAIRACRRLAAGDDSAPSFDFNPYRDYRGVHVVGAWAVVPQTNWFVIAEIDHADFVAPVNAAFRTMLVLTALACLVVTFVGIIVARRLLAPVRRLTGAAERVTGGDHTARCGVAGHDELGRLGVAFDTMAETIEQTIAAQQREIAERRRTERSLRASEERFRTLFETAPDAMIIIDGVRMTDCNPAALEMLRFTSAEEAARHTAIDMSPLRQPDGVSSAVAAELHLAETLRAGHHRFEWTFRRTDGEEFPAEVAIHVIHRDDRPAFHVTIRDITQQRLEEQHERERMALAESCKTMERVLGVVAHEMRTPLGAMRAISELVLEQHHALDESTAALLHMMHAETLRMAAFVDDVLEAARLNSGRANWNWQNITLADIGRDAIALIDRTRHDSDIELNLDVRPDDLTMRGDGEAIRRLVVNLVNNALRHTREGSVDVTIEPMPRISGRWIRLTVRDTGEGIDPQIAAKLGEAFALNSGVVGNATHGTGLGLSICAGIVAAHGGRLTVDSRLGEGATFTAVMRTDLTEAASIKTDDRIISEHAA